MHKYLLAAALLSIPALAQPTFAQTTQSINHQSTRLYIAHGNGITFSFLNTEETIQKVILDNPSFMVHDFQPCDAEECGQQLLHLNRIKDLVLEHIQNNGSTSLQIITKNQQTGEVKIHFYTVIKGNSTSKNFIPIGVQPTTTAASPTINPTNVAPTEIATKIRATLAKPEIADRVDLKMRLKLLKFASLLEMGTKEANALQLANLSDSTIREILNYAN
ncbi:MAG: hypothetical protein RLZZ381_3016 [Cyanobacteriota bacterium]|jgi:hypothetical protein